MTTTGLVVRIGAAVLFGSGSVAGAIISARKGSKPGITASIAAGAAAAYVLARTWWP